MPYGIAFRSCSCSSSFMLLDDSNKSEVSEEKVSTNCHYSPACTVQKYFRIDMTVLNHNKKFKQPIQKSAASNKCNFSMRKKTCQEPEFHKNMVLVCLIYYM